MSIVALTTVAALGLAAASHLSASPIAAPSDRVAPLTVIVAQERSSTPATFDRHYQYGGRASGWGHILYID